MDLLKSLEKEVADAASQMTAEVVLLLLDKWEKDLELAIATNSGEIPELLNRYVRLKITLHKLSRSYERGWSCDLDENRYAERAGRLQGLVKEARRKYYVTKQRFESDKHKNGCSCRGCRCIAGVNG
jgi:hypothetical protein